MKKRLLMSGVVLVCLAATAMAVPGETWILPIHHRDGGGWTEYPGAGYDGTSAWGANTMDGVRRVYWELSGTGSMGNAVPGTTELYTIEVFGATAGGTAWQPVESQIKGVDGETYPMEPMIPWDGAYGTNHQYVGSDGSNDGAWHSTGPGPHTPESAAQDAGPGGIYMWLGGHGSPSWLYAKWDYGWAIDRSWSALRLTQITPEPTSLLFLLLGAPLLRRRGH